MCRFSRLLLTCCFAGLVGVGAEGAEIKLKPISASGSHNFVGNEIILDGGGQRVFLEVRAFGWSPATLTAYQATLDATGYSSGTSGVLTPATQACAVNADCTAAFGAGSNCGAPGVPAGQCPAGFINSARTDYVFNGIANLPAVDLSTLNYRFASLVLFGSKTDPGGESYGGTLVLEVAPGTVGTFTVGFVAADSNMVDSGSNNLPLTLTPALITVLCTSNADCADGNACTNDICNLGNGTCSNPNNFNPNTQCCDPSSGGLTQIDDGNDCTVDVCDAQTGQVSHDPRVVGTLCGDPTDTECNKRDTCDGAGTCQDNFEINGFACGSPLNTECTDPDTCDGFGTCLPNHASAVTPCGDPADTDCDNPDTCSGLGVCLSHNEPNGTTCNDGLFCNVSETCTAGACGGGGPRNCGDGIPCTTDACDDNADMCVHTIDTGFCLIANVCIGNGQLNPANDCENCATASSTTNWTPLSTGSACGDPANTDCTNPDTCDGAGGCQDNHEVLGTACGDPTNDDCTNPDTCNATGTCLVNHEPDGLVCTDDGNDCTRDVCGGGGCTHPNEPSNTPCGDPSDTDCDNPDTCNGVGTCLANHETDGTAPAGMCVDGNDCTKNECLVGVCVNPNEPLATACGDPSDTDCDNPDTCDGAGFCEDNLELNGFGCTDDGNDCTADTCDGVGICAHPNLSIGHACGDPIDTECTNPDTCNGTGTCLDNHELNGTACGDPSDTVCTNPDACDGAGNCLDLHEPDGTSCDDTLFCNGEDLCATGVCEHAGSPCGGPCDEDFDQCLCEAPLVEVVGSRYLKITPQPPGSGPQAILITPDCPGAVGLYGAPPVLIDIDRDGAMDDNISNVVDLTPDAAAFLTPAAWGDLYVYGEALLPGQRYIVQGDCGSPGTPGLSDPTTATTCVFGDTTGGNVNGVWTLCQEPPLPDPPPFPVTIIDIIAGVEGFMNLASAPPLYMIDIIGTGNDVFECPPDQAVGVIPDVVLNIEAFQGKKYEIVTGCPSVCP